MFEIARKLEALGFGEALTDSRPDFDQNPGDEQTLLLTAESGSIWKLTHGFLRAFRRPFALAVGNAIAFLVCNWISPGLLQVFLERLSSGGAQSVLPAAGGLIGVSFVSWFFLNHCFDQAFRFSLRVRGLCGRAITAEAIRRGKTDDIVSFLNQDLEKIQDAAYCLPLFVLTFSTVLISCALLLKFLGPGGLVGGAALLSIGFVTQKLTRRLGREAGETARLNARRTRLVEFIVGSLETIWTRGWKGAVRNHLGEIRARETAQLRVVGYWVVVLNVLLLATPLVATFMSLLPSYFLTGGLTPASIFPSLMVLSLLRSATANLPKIIAAIAQGAEALSRFGDRLRISPHSVSTPLSADLLRAIEGRRVAVVGRSGSGRTTFLRTLAEKRSEQARVAFVEQNPWIFAGTIASNVVGLSALDPIRVDRVLQIVELARDLEQKQSDAHHGVEPGGRNLSGGQRQRLALARVLYASADTVILDESFSALDPEVRKRVRDGFSRELEAKTFVVTTSDFSEAMEAELVVELHEGRVRHWGVPEELARDATSLLHGRLKRLPTENKIDLGIPLAEERPSEPLSTDAFEAVALTATSYREYFKLLGGSRFFFVVASLMLMREALTVLGDIWITRGSQQSGVRPEQMTTFLVVYALCFLGSVSLSAGAAHYLIRQALRAASDLHERVTRRLFQDTVRGLRALPGAAHLARLVHDQRIVDQSVGQKLIDFLTAVSTLTGTFGLVAYSVPELAPLFVILAVGYWHYSRIYRGRNATLSHTAAETAGETMASAREFASGGVWLIHHRSVDAWKQARFVPSLHRFESSLFSAQRLERWFSLRLELMGTLIFTATVLYAAVHVRAGGTFTVTQGLAITYATMMTAVLGRVIRMLADLDRDVVSVRRLMGYQAGQFSSGEEKSSALFPQALGLHFSEVGFYYPQSPAPALVDVSFSIAPGEKVSVVGRTGSGKSTITNLCLGLHSPSSGTVSIGKESIARLDEAELARRIYLVPQTAIFLPGKLRDSIAPREVASELVWESLRQVGVSEAVTLLPDGLDTIVEPGDAPPLSTAQQKRVLLAGAILTPAPIVILDEPTAGIGSREAGLLVENLLSALSGKTVIAITHQEELRAQFDRVLELSNGRLIQDAKRTV